MTCEFISKAEILIEALPVYTSLPQNRRHQVRRKRDDQRELKSSVMDDITLLKFVGINPCSFPRGPDINQMLSRMDILPNSIKAFESRMPRP
jgi:acetylglutamate kinase